MPTINQLSAVDQINDGDQFPLYSPNAGDARKASFTTVKESLAGDFASLADLAAQTGAGLVGTSDGTTVQQALDSKPTATLDTDGTLAANSDGRVASQKATKTYADTKVATAALAAVSGSSLVGFQQSGSSPLAATVQSKERQILSAADFAGFDATGATASTTAIQNAINEASARGYCDVMIPKGAKTGALSIPSTVGLIGPNTKATLVADTGTYTTLTINGSDTFIKNLDISESAKSGGSTFLLACGTTGKDRNTVENIVTRSSWQLFADSGTGNGVHTSTKLRDIQAKVHRGPGLVWTRGFAFLELDHIIIDYVGVSASDFTGFSFSGAGLPAGAGGLIIERCDVLGTMGVTTNPNQIGYVFSDINAIRIRNSRADTCGSDGWRFTNVVGVLLDDVAAGLCDGHGMVFTGCTSVIGNKLFLFGRNYLPTPSANKDGVRFVSGNAGVNLNTVTTIDFTGNGIHKVAAQPGGILVTGHQAFNNTGRAVKTVGGSAFTITGFQYGGNTAGNYDLGGGFDYLLSGQFNSGAALSLTGPGPVTG